MQILKHNEFFFINELAEKKERKIVYYTFFLIFFIFTLQIEFNERRKETKKKVGIIEIIIRITIMLIIII
jgi:hypothetical protein